MGAVHTITSLSGYVGILEKLSNALRNNLQGDRVPTEWLILSQASTARYSFNGSRIYS